MAQRLPRNDQMRFTCHARASLATTNLLGISRVIRSRFNICRGADGRVLQRPGDAIPPAGCFTRRSLPPIYIRGTRPPPTADETDTESEQENRAVRTKVALVFHVLEPVWNNRIHFVPRYLGGVF